MANPPITDTLIQQMTNVIVEKLNPQQVILFGSQARGTARLDSDIDLLIVAAEPFRPGRSRRQEMTKAWRLLASFGISTDILVYSQDEIEQWRDTKNHVVARALREGKVLYERS